MFRGSGTVSTFFERLPAALAPEYELLRQLGSGGMGTVHVMDYLEGDTLQAHLEKHGRGRDLLAALGKAHRKGVIHLSTLGCKGAT